jgi:hypothetical protein
MKPSSISRSLVALLATAVVALLAAGCGSSSTTTASSGGADPAASVPATAPIYLEAVLKPKGDQKANAEAILGKLLNTADAGAEIRKTLDDQTTKHADGVVFSRDIEPWLGDRVAVAVTKLDATSADDTKALVILDTSDPGKAKDTLEKADKADKGTSVKRSYRDVDYVVSDDTAYAIVGDVVLFGDESVLKSSLDVIKGGGQSLADTAAFKKVRTALGQDGLGTGYLDFNAFIKAVADDSTGSTAAGLQALKGFAGSALSSQLGASISTSANAIKLDGVVTGAAKSAASAAGDGPGAVAAAPADAWLSVGVGDVGGLAQKAIKQLGQAGALGGQDPATLMAQLNAQFGVDVEKDLLAWMGDTSIWVSGTSKSDLRVAMVITSKDPAASQQAIGKLDRLLAKLNQPAKSVTIAGKPGLEIAAGSVGTIQIAAKGDKFVIAFGQGAAEQALEPSGTLASSDPFKAVSAEMGGVKPSVFIDTAALLKFASGVAGPNATYDKARPTLAHLGPIAFGAHTDGDIGRLKGAIVIK